MAGTAADAIGDIAKRLLAERDKRVAELEAAVRAALNMVDGDGAPPDWDALRKLVKK